MLSLGKIVLITQTPSRAKEVSLTKLYLFWNRNTSTKIKREKTFFTVRTLKSQIDLAGGTVNIRWMSQIEISYYLEVSRVLFRIR